MFAHLDREMDHDTVMMKIWGTIQEFSDQLSHNQKLATSLQGQTNALKEQAAQKRSGYSLRRFNVDLSQEVFESELEKTNAQTLIENKTLMHENKQLGLLLKEYEQTMDTVMSRFRSQAVAAQQHDATLRQHYEYLLMLQKHSTGSPGSSLLNTQTSASLQRLSYLLQTLENSLDGEQREKNEENTDGQEDDRKGLRPEDEYDEREDWAVEREIEISRLEKENEELRKRLGIDEENTRNQGWKDEELQEHGPMLFTLRAIVEDALPWRQGVSPQLTPFTAAPVPGNAAAVQPYPQLQQQAQNQQQQQQQQQTVPLQLPPEFQSGMRAAGAMRRQSIFGRGAAPIWDGSTVHERPWLQNHGGLDLAG